MVHFACENCNKVFDRKYNLERHLKSKKNPCLLIIDSESDNDSKTFQNESKRIQNESKMNPKESKKIQNELKILKNDSNKFQNEFKVLNEN